MNTPTAPPPQPATQETAAPLPPPPVEVKPTHSNRRIWPPIVLLLIVIGAAATYVFLRDDFLNQRSASTPTPAPTPASSPSSSLTWSTYNNSLYGFSIDYPGDWSLKESDSKKSVTFTANSNDVVSAYIGRKSGGYDDTPLEEYAKVAAIKEVQNHNQLASFKRITTTSGLVGYETTWMVQSLGNPQAEESESTPITYFDIPGDNMNLLRITLDRDEDLAVYEKMLNTVKFTPSNNSTPTPTVDEKSVLQTTMKKYIANEHGGSEDSYSITVSKIDGNYAQGEVSADGGGGLWFAAKEDGLWKLVWDGNGIVDCASVSLYPDFPKTMIPICLDETIQDTVKR